MTPRTCITVVPLLAMLAACSNVDLGAAAAAGRPVSASVTARTDGTLHADRLFVASETEEESDDEEGGVDCVDGIDAATGAECDGGPSANQDDGEEGDEEEDAYEEGGVDCVDGLTAAGAECDGGPAANTDNDGDGDVDEEDASYDAGRARMWIRGVPSLVPERGIYQLLGLDVNPGANTVGEGAVKFVGQYNGDRYFSAAQVRSAGAGAAVGGISEGIVDHGDGTWTLTVFGTDVVVDRSTTLQKSADPLSEEAEGDDEHDGVDCEQEGEHAGDNEGC